MYKYIFYFRDLLLYILCCCSLLLQVCTMRTSIYICFLLSLAHPLYSSLYKWCAFELLFALRVLWKCLPVGRSIDLLLNSFVSVFIWLHLRFYCIFVGFSNFLTHFITNNLLVHSFVLFNVQNVLLLFWFIYASNILDV